MQRRPLYLSLVLLSSCAGIPLHPQPAQEVGGVYTESTAVLAGGELLALILAGKGSDAARCMNLIAGPTAQFNLALAPQGLPKEALWELDFTAVIACAARSF